MQQELRALILQKDQLEKQIAELALKIDNIDQLKNFNSGLVDAEGFPRPDINFGQLAEYRNLKRRKAQLNNDHLALMKTIEQKLYALHATLPKIEEHHNSETFEHKHTEKAFVKKEKPQEKTEEKPIYKIDYLTPFAKVTLVSENAPAEKAGLKVGDLLSQFADISIYSMDWLKQIPEVVKEGIPIKVVVMRKVEGHPQNQTNIFLLKDGNSYQKIELSLTPGRWEGRGLLGCKLDPLSS